MHETMKVSNVRFWREETVKDPGKGSAPSALPSLTTGGRNSEAGSGEPATENTDSATVPIEGFAMVSPPMPHRCACRSTFLLRDLLKQIEGSHTRWASRPRGEMCACNSALLFYR